MNVNGRRVGSLCLVVGAFVAGCAATGPTAAPGAAGEPKPPSRGEASGPSPQPSAVASATSAPLPVASAPVAAPSASAPDGPSPESIEIATSASTNNRGYSLTVEPSGKVTYRGDGKGVKPALPRALADRLFKDVASARPLAALQVPTCAKPASGRSDLTVAFRGESSPDLSCPGQQGKAKLLADDIGAIWKALSASGG